MQGTLVPLIINSPGEDDVFQKGIVALHPAVTMRLETPVVYFYPPADAKLPMVQVVSMQQAGGAIARVAPTATAFAQRAIQFNMFVLAAWRDPAQSEAAGQWARGAWKNVEPHTHGFYVNEFNDDGGRMKATYGVNYDRMVALKTKVDPNNLFRLNANIQPKSA